jgi:hypothetical protein
MGMGATPVFPVVLTHRDGDQPWTLTSRGGFTTAHHSLGDALAVAVQGCQAVTMSPFTVEAVRAAVAVPPMPTTVEDLAAVPGWTRHQVFYRLMANSPADRWPQVGASTDGSVWLEPVEGGNTTYLYGRANEADAVRLALDLYRAFHGRG